MKALQIVLSGIGGYGAQFLNLLLDKTRAEAWTLAGVIEPDMAHHPREEGWLRAREIPVADSLSTFFHQLGGHADLTIVASPVQYHFEQCYEALRHGSHVLCTQPVVSDYRQAMTLEQLAEESGLQLAAGYSALCCDTLIRLKQDAVQGRFGKLLSMRGLSLTGHSDLYYQHNPWAGRFFDREGRSVQDGVMHNASAQLLHTMLYLAGHETDGAAQIKSMRGEWCRARSIASYDTAALMMAADSCPAIYFGASYAWAGQDVHRYRFVWEDGYAEGDLAKSRRLIVHSQDAEIDYGELTEDPLAKLTRMTDCIRHKWPVSCSIRSAKAEVAACNGLYLSAGSVRTLQIHELQLVRGATGTPEEGAVYATAPRITTLLEECYQKLCLPVDLFQPLGGVPKEVTMTDILHGIPSES